MENKEDQKDELTVYEIGYLVLPSIPEEEVSKVTDSIKKVIAEEGGSEIDGETPFKQKLAYSMSKTVGASRYVVDDAYLGWIKFELDKTKALDLKSKIEKISEVLRFLLIKTPRKTTFTFAKAREKKALEKKALEEGNAEEAGSKDERAKVKNEVK